MVDLVAAMGAGDTGMLSAGTDWPGVADAECRRGEAVAVEAVALES